MRLCARSMAITAAVIWGAAIFFIGIGSMFFAGYGSAVLDLVASVYPGYNNTGGVGDLAVGTLLAAADGLIGGFVFAWLYNRVADGSAAK